MIELKSRIDWAVPGRERPMSAHTPPVAAEPPKPCTQEPKLRKKAKAKEPKALTKPKRMSPKQSDVGVADLLTEKKLTAFGLLLTLR